MGRAVTFLNRRIQGATFGRGRTVGARSRPTAIAEGAVYRIRPPVQWIGGRRRRGPGLFAHPLAPAVRWLWPCWTRRRAETRSISRRFRGRRPGLRRGRRPDWREAET